MFGWPASPAFTRVVVVPSVHCSADQPRPDDDVRREGRPLRALLPPQHRQDQRGSQQAILQTAVWPAQQTPGHLSRQVRCESKRKLINTKMGPLLTCLRLVFFFVFRIYVNFVDMDAANVGWNNTTFG